MSRGEDWLCQASAAALRSENERLRKWASDAYAALHRGVILMSVEQVSRWEGVRAAIEQYPVEGEE